MFTRLFGSAQTLSVAIKKVLADGLVHVPLCYLPLYYTFEASVLKDGPVCGLRQYSVEWWECMKPYWSMWSVVHFVNFRFTPPELRIAVVAGVSFFWLVILSHVSHKSYEAERMFQADEVSV
eukprot:CAMPEP_0194489594 /NCGR_PEP_ID=MMETSP0253-20130528/9082_1 /TAXON_ID=2966 /ORGANISM="Noctiluca scintillans" /LENGTH=121 /DNA_ID=CAMNT_0039330085 /DNA_START=327 /DNA_END=688 /DNA_ORIENTATION=-